MTHTLPEPTARYVKLLVTRTGKSPTGKYKAQVAEVQLIGASSGSAVRLEWTAPGDDGKIGTAAAYDLRWSTRAITGANFGAADPVTTSAPSPAGRRETAIVPGIYDPALADVDLGIDTEKAIAMTRRLAREEGLLVGISAGANVAAALAVAGPPAVVVTVLCDGGERYLSEPFWEGA